MKKAESKQKIPATNSRTLVVQTMRKSLEKLMDKS